MKRSLLSIVFSVLVIIVSTLTITSNTIFGSSNAVTAAYAQENNNNNIINDNNPTSATVGEGQRVSFLTDDKVLIVGTNNNTIFCKYKCSYPSTHVRP
jgi:hypothetical protein